MFSTLKSVAMVILELIPPYRNIEGRLSAKERGPENTYNILVEDQIVEVDWLTFDTLIPGEPLRLRCTRTNKAINIDRLHP